MFNWLLVDKVCACGCGRSWKALPTSKSEFASTRCSLPDGQVCDVLFNEDNHSKPRRRLRKAWPLNHYTPVVDPKLLIDR